MEAINEAGTGPSISQPTGFTAATESPECISNECYVESFNNFVLGFIYSLLIAMVIFFIFLFIVGYIIKRNKKRASVSNEKLRCADVMNGGSNVPPSYSKYISTSEEDNSLLPSYAESLERLPSYTSVRVAIIPGNIQPIEQSQATIYNGDIYSYPESMEITIAGRPEG